MKTSLNKTTLSDSLEKELKGEIWKTIPGYEKKYQVSSYGRIRSLNRVNKVGAKLKGGIMSRTYHTRHENQGARMDLRDASGTRKTYTVANLVIKVFNRERKPGEMVRRKDDNYKNDFSSNLYYDSYKTENYVSRKGTKELAMEE